ncbi:MAG: DNA repair protein RecN [Clostridia bacterium]|nr:DNA repair protein RecN [Clostridia bacterium]
MLSVLSIENIALISKLELELKHGLNILSGETGAGKSIIIDSLNFVLGERADKSLIRYGADYAVVQATFEDYLTPAISWYLDDMGIDVEDVLIIRRKMSTDGKNECRINGRLTNLSILRGLTSLLVDIHGQHEHQSLLNPKNHLSLLDSIGEAEIKPAKEKVASAYGKFAEISNQLADFGDKEERERRLDILAYQLAEIDEADVKEGEEEELLSARKRIRNMEKILTALETAKSTLEGYNGESIPASLKSASANLNQIVDFDDELPAIQDRLLSCKVEIEDIADSLESKVEQLGFDARSADTIEKRLETVRLITRRYGGSYESIRKFYDEANEEFDMLQNADETVAKLEKEVKIAGENLILSAEKLTKLRKATADKFEKTILKELADLGMAGSTFKVQIDSTDNVYHIDEEGADEVEFLISPNVGEPLKPLAKIISGGEMSRFMLALKNIVAKIDGIGTMVFDEIDTGISGNISAVVAEKMCNISRNRQVIAVTHMPSLAAMADNHYLIAKSTENGKTLTHVSLLKDDTDELARLIGGDSYSAYAVPHAKEMRAWADRYKASLK